MTPQEAISNVRAAFAAVPRPEAFTRGTCLCEECEEHGETLKTHTPDSISLVELGNPGWDPMCMANDQAFAYYVPGLVRLAFEDPYYADQMLFHFNCPGRAEYFTAPQAVALRDTIWLLVEIAPEKFGLDLADEALRRLERIIAGLPPSEH